MEKVALITGASSGLGEATARLFGEKGFKVIAVSRSKPEIEIDCWIQADVTEKSGHEKMLMKVEEEFGRLDLLVNNAGRGSYATWEELGDEQLRELFELNFFALVNIIYTFLPLLKKSKGTIVNIASVAGKQYIPCMGPYCATKHAVRVLSETLRLELRRDGVKVINVAPGHIDTGFVKNSVGPRRMPFAPVLGSSSEGLAKRLYTAYRRSWRSFTYPRIYSVFIILAYIFPGIYDMISIKAWKLDNRKEPEKKDMPSEATAVSE